MDFEWIPEEVFVISATYLSQEDNSYRSFMFGALRQDGELWMYVEYRL